MKMRKYYVAAIVPLIVALGCVCVAWKLLQNRSAPTPKPPPLSMKLTPSSTSPTPKKRSPVPLHPSSTMASTFVLPGAQNYTNVTLPSDHLEIPVTQTRELVPLACVDLERGTRVWKLNFDSSCKDGVQWPTTSHWRMDLSTFVRNVTSTTLRSVGLEPAEYTVDVWNNMVDVEVGGTQYAVAVELGMYANGTDLATAISTAFVATHAALAGFSVVYTALTDRMTVSESTPTQFSLLWGSGENANTSLWKTMGFLQQDVSSTLSGGAHQVDSPGRVDLYGPLAIDVFADELTNCLEGPLGRVLLSRSVEGAPVFRENTLDNHHTFWPISKIQFITFNFMVQYGHINADGTVVCKYRPYEFHGRHNTVQLDFGVMSYMNPLEAEVQLEPIS